VEINNSKYFPSTNFQEDDVISKGVKKRNMLLTLLSPNLAAKSL
jgi:hypothetical protein